MRRNFVRRSQHHCIRCRVGRVVMALDNIVLDDFHRHWSYARCISATIRSHAHPSQPPCSSPWQERQRQPLPSSDSDLIEEIVVTAQKRESALQDVPFSVAAASEQQIRDSGSTNIVDLSRNFAGLTITDLGPGQSQVAIRGISAGQVVRDLVGGVKESVGVYLDESAISQALFTPDLELFDLERFEVLRGPQGTLFGAGSSTGTVRYITRQPQLERFEGAIEVGGHGGTDSDIGSSARGAMNLPMGESTALRLVGYYNDYAGFIDSVYPDRDVREDVNGGEKYGGRLALLIQPSEYDLDHAARDLSAVDYRRLPAHRCLQPPRQSVHDDGARGEPR